MTTLRKKVSMSVDATRTWTDPNGHEWEIAVEFKGVDGRPDFAGVMIKPTNTGYPLTRRVLAQLPLLDLFGESMYREQLDFDRWQQRGRSAKQHQGRTSTDEELMLVAEIRVSALQANFPVQRAVAMALGITEGTAGNRIKAARMRGFIPPSNRKTPK